MGLDISLGVLVLLSAVRGWFKGFLRQAIPLGALIGCVYAADPLRDLARPHAVKSFPSIGPPVMDRLLWWTCATVSYVVVAGIGLSVVKAMKKKTYGDPEPNRADQGAGFTLGALKGALLASFLAWGVSSYGPNIQGSAPFVGDLTRESRALSLSEKYSPARTIWTSPPIRNFVARVKDRGLGIESGAEKNAPTKDAAPVETAAPKGAEEPLKTASQSPRTLSLPRLNPDSPDFDRELEDEMRKMGLDPSWR